MSTASRICILNQRNWINTLSYLMASTPYIDARKRTPELHHLLRGSIPVSLGLVLLSLGFDFVGVVFLDEPIWLLKGWTRLVRVSSTHRQS